MPKQRALGVFCEPGASRERSKSWMRQGPSKKRPSQAASSRGKSGAGERAFVEVSDAAEPLTSVHEESPVGKKNQVLRPHQRRSSAICGKKQHILTGADMAWTRLADQPFLTTAMSGLLAEEAAPADAGHDRGAWFPGGKPALGSVGKRESVRPNRHGLATYDSVTPLCAEDCRPIAFSDSLRLAACGGLAYICGSLSSLGRL